MIQKIARQHSARDTPKPDRNLPARAIAASLGLHGLLLLALLNAPFEIREPRTSTGRFEMRLVTRPPPEQPPDRSEPEQQPEPAASPEVPPAPASEPDQPELIPDATTADETDARPDPDFDIDPSETPARELRSRVLEQVGKSAAEDEPAHRDALPWTPGGQPVPGLPGARGWIAGHIGRVRPSSDTWSESDGSRGGRYVLADGTVVCTRRRAPTIDEHMNPWKSTIVTMAGICGRERPEAPDFTNPLVQPPPTRISGRAVGSDE